LDTLLGGVDLAVAVVEALFGLLLVISLRSFLGEAMTGKTRVQQFKGADRGEISKTEALEKICGVGSACCWICATDAFPYEIVIFEFQSVETTNILNLLHVR
jgi:hypothetical protein